MVDFSGLSIVTAPHPALDTPSEPVAVFDASLRLLAVRMTELMHRGPDGLRGIGLAANQLNVMRRVIVVDVPGKKSVRDLRPMSVTRGPLVVVNPVVTLPPVPPAALSTATEADWSHPGVALEVPRSSLANVSGLDVNGRRVEFFTQGLLARVVQHLVDLLDGVSMEARVAMEAAKVKAASARAAEPVADAEAVAVGAEEGVHGG